MTDLPTLCREVLELDEKGTAKPWKFGRCDAIQESSISPIFEEHMGEHVSSMTFSDMRLIAKYRSAAPQLARALTAALDALRHLAAVSRDEYTRAKAEYTLAAIEGEGRG